MTRWAAWVAAVGLVLGMGAQAQAAECKTCRCDAQRFWTHPHDGAAEVPLNARVFVSAPGAAGALDRVRLVDAGGVDVPHRREPTGGAAHTAWLVPEAPLRPGSTYTVLATADTQAHFTTSLLRVDEGAPTLAGVSAVADLPTLAGRCAAAGGTVLSVDARDDLNSGDLLLVQVDLTWPDGTHRRALQPLEGGRVVLGHMPQGGLTEQLYAGVGSCFGDGEVGGLDTLPTRVQVAVLDWTGRASAPLDVGLPGWERTGALACQAPPAMQRAAAAPLQALGGVGCSAGGVGGAGTLAGVLLWTLALARRRSRAV